MKTLLLAGLSLGLLGASALAQSPAPAPAATPAAPAPTGPVLPNPAAKKEPIALRDMGSFHIGGRIVEVTGKPVREVLFAAGGTPAKMDPNGPYQVEQMYVQYFFPANRKGKYPLLMWHGGGLTGVTYETTPDGRDGWLNMFVRKGWDVYNSDAVERGRSGYPSPDVWPSSPIFLARGNAFERFRIGQGPGSWSPDPAKLKVLPGSQFPVEAYDNFVRQNVPRWLDSDKPIIAAYTELVEKVCPCVILFHSQAGGFAFKVAQEHPDKVKALVAVEPAVPGDPEKAAALKNVPILMVFGDFIKQDSRWPAMRGKDVAFGDAVKAAGGSVDVIDLPDVGLKGNSHMLMMDKTNGQVADLIQEWLVKKGLVD
ncbi:esterase [Rhodoplanes roseus]|uniref:esterase n=1 Tax=Rhodoplanes roseus TaxID=29409 RepID=UPI001FE19EA6|nr:esterase [Rhodoplanes roseus]